MSDPRSHSPRSVAIVGDVYRFLASGDETGGRYALLEGHIPAGGGPPPHIHTREVEAFYGLTGRIAIYLEEQRIELTPGAFAHVPIGTLHTFRNETTQSASMLILIAPAGLEQMFLEVGRVLDGDPLAAAPPTPEVIARLVAAAPRYGVELLAPTEP